MSLANNGRLKTVEDFRQIVGEGTHSNGDNDLVAGAIHVYESALLNRDASGNLKISGDTASELFAGIAMEEVDQASTASAGDNQVGIISAGSGRLVKMKLTGVTKAQIGLSAYAKADDEVQLVGDATNDVLVGVIRKLDEVANYCWVQI